MSLNVGTLSGILELDTKPHDDALDRSEQRYGKMAKAAGLAVAGIAGALVAAGAKAFGMSNEFNAAMANVGSLIPGNTKRVVELKGAVQDLAIEVGAGTKDIAAGLYQTESAFGDNADTVKILEINAKAAKAGVASVSDAIALTSAVTKGYGDTTAGAVQHAADLAALTVRLGQTTFPELASSIGLVTPLTASLKVSQEELFAVMATGTGVTGGASEVATQLRGVMQSLMAPTADVTKLMKQQHVADGQALVAKLGLKGTMDLLVHSAEKSGKPLQNYISSIEGQTLALALAGGQNDAYRQKLAEMQKSAGATDAAFKAQTEGVNRAGFMWDQMRVKGEVAMQKLGDWIGETAFKLNEKFGPAVQDGVEKGIGFLGDFRDRAAPIVGEVVDFVRNINWSAIGDGIQAAADVALPIIEAVRSYVVDKLGAAVDWVRTYWPQIEEAVGHTMRAVREVIGVVVDFVMTIWRAWGDDLLSVAKRIFGLISESIENAVKFWQGVIKTVLALINGDWGKAWDGIKQILAAVWDQMKNIVSTAVALLKSVLGAGVSALQEIWRGAWDIIARALNAAWDGIYKYLSSQLDHLLGWFRDLPGNIVGAIGGIGNKMFEIGSRIVEGLVNGIKRGAGAVVDAIKNLGGGIIGKALSVFGVASPSKVFIRIGGYLMEGLRVGMVKGYPALLAEAQRIFSDLSGQAGDILSGFGVIDSRAAAQKAVDAAEQALAKLRGEQGQLPEAIRQATAERDAAKANAAKVTPEELQSILDARQAVVDAKADDKAATEALAQATQEGGHTSAEMEQLQLAQARAANALVVAQRELNQVTAESTAETQDVADAQEKLNDLLEAQRTIGTRVKDAQDALTKSKLDAVSAEKSYLDEQAKLIGTSPQAVDLFKQLAAAAGLSKDEINALVNAYEALRNGMRNITPPQLGSNVSAPPTAMGNGQVAVNGDTMVADWNGTFRRVADIANLVGAKPLGDGRYNVPDGAKILLPNGQAVQAGAVAQRTYDAGGILPPGLTLSRNLTGENEFVFRAQQLRTLVASAANAGPSATVAPSTGTSGGEQAGGVHYHLEVTTRDRIDTKAEFRRMATLRPLVRTA